METQRSFCSQSLPDTRGVWLHRPQGMSAAHPHAWSLRWAARGSQGNPVCRWQHQETGLPLAKGSATQQLCGPDEFPKEYIWHLFPPCTRQDNMPPRGTAWRPVWGWAHPSWQGKRGSCRNRLTCFHQPQVRGTRRTCKRQREDNCQIICVKCPNIKVTNSPTVSKSKNQSSSLKSS